jgi:hypothetical protein
MQPKVHKQKMTSTRSQVKHDERAAILIQKMVRGHFCYYQYKKLQLARGFYRKSKGCLGKILFSERYLKNIKRLHNCICIYKLIVESVYNHALELRQYLVPRIFHHYCGIMHKIIINHSIFHIRVTRINTQWTESEAFELSGCHRITKQMMQILVETTPIQLEKKIIA